MVQPTSTVAMAEITTVITIRNRTLANKVLRLAARSGMVVAECRDAERQRFTFRAVECGDVMLLVADCREGRCDRLPTSGRIRFTIMGDHDEEEASFEIVNRRRADRRRGVRRAGCLELCLCPDPRSRARGRARRAEALPLARISGTERPFARRKAG